MTLYDKTMELLKNLPRSTTYADIERDTNLSKEWISAVARGRIIEPSVKKIQTLYEYLSKRKLKL